MKKKTAILGLGVSGAAAAELLLREGAGVVVFDDRDDPVLRKRAGRLAARGGAVCLGAKAASGWEKFEEIIVSPGVLPDHLLLRRARREKIPVRSEIELAARFLPGRLIAVTGTNGKTTTVTLLAEILSRAGIPAAAGGNIGYPLSRIALDHPGCAVVVAEISSFQLEGIETFRPDSSLFLNLSPDHLDRYPTPKEYGRAKLRIFQNQREGDRALIPEGLLSFCSAAIPPGVEKITWGGEGGMARVEGGELHLFSDGGQEAICRVEEIPVRGPAYLENALAAAVAARREGVSAETIGAVLRTFPGLPHRMEFVAEVKGVGFYNDSKATNPSAVASAWRSFDRPLIWLAGGSDKGLDFSLLSPLLPGPVKEAILLGASREKLRRLLEGKIPFQTAATLEEAVAAAFRAARPGDAVLLSPGCASFDMFENYQARGDLFKALVGRLAASGNSG